MPTFEELFGKQPDNYVQSPPQKVATLEQFFKERTPAPAPKENPYNMFGENFLKDVPRAFTGPSPVATPTPKEVAKPISDDVVSTAQAAPNIEPTRLEELKAIFQPQAQAAPEQQQETMTQPATSASNVIDADRVRQQADTLAPQATGTDFALGLIPLAVDALTGGTGAGLDVSGKYYMDKASGMEKRKQTLEDKLMEIERARSIAGAKGSGKMVEVDVNGKPIFTSQGKAEGMQAWKAPQKETGLTPDEWNRREDYKARIKSGLQKDKLSAQELKDNRDLEVKLSKEWSSDDFTRGTRKVADAYKRIERIDPNNTNRIEEMGAIFDLMKSLDPQSVVRESEQAMAIGARSYSDVLNYFDSILSGESKLTKTQLQNIKKFAGNLYRSRMESQNELNKGYTERAMRYSLNPENVIQKLSDAPIPGKLPKVGTKIEQNGYTYTVGKNGELE